MFVGIRMELLSYDVSYYIKEGKEVLKSDLNVIHKNLQEYLMDTDALSADKIMDDWFPSIDANVFISHSHKDKKLAYGLAGFLKSKFDIKSFIDSSVWGYANDLLKLIDEDYSVLLKYPDGSVTYDYNKRNFSTSHVHMMLNDALMKMIDKIECIIFLNTPNSIVFRDGKDKTFTDSPWIYSELLMTQLLRKKELKEYRKNIIEESLSYRADELSILYEVSIDNLCELRFNDLKNISAIKGEPYKNLDRIYRRLEIKNDKRNKN